MDLSNPLTTLVPGLTGKVLAAIVNAPRPLSGREVARRAGGSQSGVARVLERLVETGLVSRRESPPSALFEWNTHHILAAPCEALVATRRRLFELIERETDGWAVAATSVVLFGSVARGDAGVESDMDLLVVRPTDILADEPVWEQQLSELAISVERWTGNPCNVIEYAADELGEIEPSFKEALRDEGVTLYGTHVRTLFPTLRKVP